MSVSTCLRIWGGVHDLLERVNSILKLAESHKGDTEISENGRSARVLDVALCQLGEPTSCYMDMVGLLYRVSFDIFVIWSIAIRYILIAAG